MQRQTSQSAFPSLSLLFCCCSIFSPVSGDAQKKKKLNFWTFTHTLLTFTLYLSISLTFFFCTLLTEIRGSQFHVREQPYFERKRMSQTTLDRVVEDDSSSSNSGIFQLPLHDALRHDGKNTIWATTTISPMSPPIVLLRRRGSAELTLVDCPEHCLVGYTDNPALTSAEHCWGERHRVYPVQFASPLTSVRLSLSDKTLVDGTKKLDFVVQRISPETRECCGAEERHAVELFSSSSTPTTQSLYFILVLASNGAKIAVDM